MRNGHPGCAKAGKEHKSVTSYTADTKMFTEAGLTLGDIAHVIYQMRIGLLTPFSYDLLLEQYIDSTIGDLAHCIWKRMAKAIRYN